MGNPVLLDNIEHHDLKIHTARGHAFGDHTNQVQVFPNEFGEVQREYPIFFRKDAKGAYLAVALLGLDRDENLFLHGEDWNARYIPAVQARGPFSIAISKTDANIPDAADLKIHIDLDNQAVNKKIGHGIFLPQGGYSPYLEHVMEVLRTLHSGIELNAVFFGALESLDLIEPVSVEIKIDDTSQYSVPDVFSISEERFLDLSPENLEKLHRSGLLPVCFAVLSSLHNVNNLVDLKRNAERP